MRVNGLSKAHLVVITIYGTNIFLTYLLTLFSTLLIVGISNLHFMSVAAIRNSGILSNSFKCIIRSGNF